MRYLNAYRHKCRMVRHWRSQNRFITCTTMKSNLFVDIVVVGLTTAVGALLGFLIQLQLLGALLGICVGMALLPKR